MNVTRLAAVIMPVMLAAGGCGLPHGGVEAVDDDDVPYHLLEDPPQSRQEGAGDQPSPRDPLVFWVDDSGQLIPRTATAGCPGDVAELLDTLLAELAAGPADEVRDQGLGTAIPPESGLSLMAVDDGVAAIDVEPESQISADRLPIAIGQLVLTVTSAPDVDRVSLFSEGELIQVPVAGGALTAAPVRAEDYAPMVPPNYRNSAPFVERPPGELPCSLGP
jgi:hypothetical protein